MGDIVDLTEEPDPAGVTALRRGAGLGDRDMGPARPVRVFILDHHPLFREGIRGVLETAGGFTVVGQAGSAAEGLAGIVATSPDVAFVDVRLSDGDGVGILRAVRSERPKTRCVVFAVTLDETTFYRSVVAGAVGYLLKDVPAERLVHVCRQVAAGRSLLGADTLDDLRERANGLPQGDTHLATLTPQEQRILGMVTQGLTNREIADRLSLAEKTVRNYVSNVLGKMGMKNRTQAAAYVARTAANHGRRQMVGAGRWSPPQVTPRASGNGG